MSITEATQEKVRARYDQLSARIDLFSAQVRERAADGRIAASRELENLRARRDELGKSLDEWKDNAGDAAEAATKGIGEAVSTLEKTFEEVADQFRS